MTIETRHGSALVYSMRELNQNTARVIQEVNEAGRPAVITRRGRFVALLTPLADSDIESHAIQAALDAGQAVQMRAQAQSSGGLRTLDDVAAELDLH